MQKIQAILLAGGKGTRLAPLTDNLPKPLVPVRGVPMIRYVLRHLQRAGVTNVAIAVAHLGHMIEDALGNGASLGMRISYLREPEPMGTGGWAKLVDWDALDEHFLVANADNLTWLNVGAFLAHTRAHDALASLAAVELPSETIANYEILRPSEDRALLRAWVDRSQTMQELAGKPTGFINSGWYVMTPRVRQFIDDVLPYSNEVHLWPRLAASGERIGFYHETGPWFDTGTHERLARVEAFLNDHNDNPDYAA